MLIFLIAPFLTVGRIAQWRAIIPFVLAASLVAISCVHFENIENGLLRGAMGIHLAA